jgi:hypothetical protein
MADEQISTRPELIKKFIEEATLYLLVKVDNYISAENDIHGPFHFEIPALVQVKAPEIKLFPYLRDHAAESSPGSPAAHEVGFLETQRDPFDTAFRVDAFPGLFKNPC